VRQLEIPIHPEGLFSQVLSHGLLGI